MKTTVQLKNDRGQIVIPEAVRKALNIRKGDILQIDVEKTEKAEGG